MDTQKVTYLYLNSMSELQKMSYDLIDFIFPDKFLTLCLEPLSQKY